MIGRKKNSNAPYCVPPLEFNGVQLPWTEERKQKFKSLTKRSEQESELTQMAASVIPPVANIIQDLMFPCSVKNEATNFNYLKILVILFHEAVQNCHESYYHTAFRSKHMTAWWLRRNKVLASPEQWAELAHIAKYCYNNNIFKKQDLLDTYRRMTVMEVSEVLAPRILEDNNNVSRHDDMDFDMLGGLPSLLDPDELSLPIEGFDY